MGGRCHDPERSIALVELGAERRHGAGDPVRDDLDLSLKPDSSALDLVDQLLAARDRVPAELSFDLASQGRNDPIAELAESGGHLVHQVPDPGHPQVVERRHQAESADPGQHPDVAMSGSKSSSFAQQGMDVECVDPMRLGFVEELGDRAQRDMW